MFNDFYRDKRVLVTGHTGFKGSWLCLWLLELGAKVAGYSISIPTDPSAYKLAGLNEHVLDFRGDISDITKLKSVFDEFKPDIVFHLAAQSLVPHSFKDPEGTYRTNVLGMVNVLECIRLSSSVNESVLITSDKVYQNHEWYWGYRESDQLGGHDPYSASKSAADLIAQSYFQSYFSGSTKKIAIARAGNVIGGGDWSENRIVPDCVRGFTNNKIVGIKNPKSTRPWQHVLEPLSGYLWLGSCLNKEKILSGEAFNFGPDAATIKTVEDLLISMSERWIELKWSNLNNNETVLKEAQLLKLCCDKSLELLGWSSVLGFDETVELTVDWYKNWAQGKVENIVMSINQINDYCKIAKNKAANQYFVLFYLY